MRVSNLFSYVKLPWLPQLSLLIYCRQCHHYLHGRIEKTYMSFRQIKVKFANAMNSVYVFFNFSKSSKVLAHIRKILPINLRWSKVRFWITRVDVLEQPPEVLHKKKTVLKIFPIFTRKHLYWSFFFTKLQTFRDCHTGAFLWI